MNISLDPSKVAESGTSQEVCFLASKAPTDPSVSICHGDGGFVVVSPCQHLVQPRVGFAFETVSNNDTPAPIGHQSSEIGISASADAKQSIFPTDVLPKN